MEISVSLSYYKRSEVQEAIVREASNKECSVRFLNEGFGKRPDVLTYPNDVLELAKKKAASFHCSEELWYNPLAIETGMKKADLDNLRLGWDLILDIDCPDWELSKLTTHMFIKALKDHGIKTIFCKFSGNKGFHIAVPFESFPKIIPFEGKQIEFKNYFPDGAKSIALYLLSYITENYAKVTEKGVSFLDKFNFNFNHLDKIAEKTGHSTTAYRCSNCKTIFEDLPIQKKAKYVCSKCSTVNAPKGNPDLIRCSSCDFPIEPSFEKNVCPECHKTSSFEKIFNFFAVVEVDTILIASRHLYRMPYSLHEGSQLVSIPINKDEVLQFEKNMANPKTISFNKKFMEREKAIPGEASSLVTSAFDFTFKQSSNKTKVRKEISIPEKAIPQKFFPPCIQNILLGLEDGKKRALFILINFLRSIGWNYENIETLVYEWNEKNPEPLREQYLKGQLFQIKKNKKVVLPPSCTNKDYYKALLICEKDEFCPRIKNPAHYSKFKEELEKKGLKKTKTPTNSNNKEILIVDSSDNVVSNKKKTELNDKDTIRKSFLLIKNHAQGILLGKFTKSNTWGLPIVSLVGKKQTYESAIKKDAKDIMGLRTFVLREGPKKGPKENQNFFSQWYFTLVERNPENFNIDRNIISELKWFPRNVLEKKFNQNPSNFKDEVKTLLIEKY